MAITNRIDSRLDSINCLKQVKCRIGCKDFIKFGLRDDHIRPESGDKDYIIDLLNAYQRGQEIGCSRNEKIDCKSMCTSSFPATNENCKNWQNSFDLILDSGRKMGMTTIDSIILFMKVGEKLGENLTEFSQATTNEQCFLVESLVRLFEKEITLDCHK
jgi:hypothetical protein